MADAPSSRLAARLLPSAVAASLLAACGAESSIKPSESLDERTGMTVGTLDKPIELVQGAARRARRLRAGARASPISGRWNGTTWATSPTGCGCTSLPATTGASTTSRRPGRCVCRSTMPRPRSRPIKPPASRARPYQPVASWGETAYFGVDLETAQAHGREPRIGLDVKAGDSVRCTSPPRRMRMRRSRRYPARPRLLTVDVDHLRQRDRRARPDVVEIHVGVVLRHQPDRQVAVL